MVTKHFNFFWITSVYFILRLLAALHFPCGVWAFSSCGAQGASLVVMGRLLLLWNTGSRLHRLSSWGTWAQ